MRRRPLLPAESALRENARKRRGFCGWKLAKLGQAAGEGCRANKPNPLDGDENIVAAFQDRIAFDKRRDGLLQLRNHPLAGRELLLEKPLEKPAFSRTGTVLDRGFIGGGGLPGQDKLLSSATVTAGMGVALGLRQAP